MPSERLDRVKMDENSVWTEKFDGPNPQTARHVVVLGRDQRPVGIAESHRRNARFRCRIGWVELQGWQRGGLLDLVVISLSSRVRALRPHSDTGQPDGARMVHRDDL